jgi:ATP-dependent protease Clp ATPase subunit
MAKEIERCSFCGRSKRDVNMLIAGLNAHICDHCVTQAQYHLRRADHQDPGVFLDGGTAQTR